MIVALRMRSETFAGFSNFRRPKIARHKVDARDYQLRSTRRELRRSIQQLTALEPALKSRISALEQQAEGAQQIISTYEEQFIAGLRDFDDLLAITRDHFDARRQAVDLKTELLHQQYRTAADFGVLQSMLLSGNY